MPDGQRNDPFLAFRFEVTLDDIKVGGFSECSGLQAELEVQEYREGGLNVYVHRFPSRLRHPVLTLRRGIVDHTLWDWYQKIIDGDFSRKNGSILLRDPADSETVVEWDFQGAFPSNWRGPELNAAQSNVAVETFELSHQGLARIQS